MVTHLCQAPCRRWSQEAWLIASRVPSTEGEAREAVSFCHVTNAWERVCLYRVRGTLEGVTELGSRGEGLEGVKMLRS
jgi:hypothetical protein